MTAKITVAMDSMVDADDFDDSDLEFDVNVDVNGLDDDGDENDTVIDLQSESASNNFSGLLNCFQNNNLCLAPEVKVSESVKVTNKNERNLNNDEILQGRILRVALERIDLSKYGLDAHGQPLNEPSRLNESSNLKKSTAKCSVLKLQENGIPPKSVEVQKTKVELKSKNEVPVEAAKVRKKNDFLKDSELLKSKVSREVIKIPIDKLSSKVLSRNNISNRTSVLTKDETSERLRQLPSEESLTKIPKLQKNVLDKFSKATKTKLSTKSKSASDAKDGDLAMVTKSSKTEISKKVSESTNSTKHEITSNCKIPSSTLVAHNISTEITELQKSKVAVNVSKLKTSKKSKVLSNCKTPSTSKLSNDDVSNEITELPQTQIAVKISKSTNSKEPQITSNCKTPSSTSKLVTDSISTKITELPKTKVAVNASKLKTSKKNKVLSKCKMPSLTSKLSDDDVSTEITELPQTQIAVKISESTMSKKSKIRSNSTIPLITLEPSMDDFSTEMFQTSKNESFLKDLKAPSIETLTEAHKSSVDDVLTHGLQLPSNDISTVVSCDNEVDQDNQQPCFDALHKAKNQKSDDERVVKDVIENVVSAVVDVNDGTGDVDAMETERSVVSPKRKIEESKTTDINDDSSPGLQEVLTVVPLKTLDETGIEGEHENDSRVGVIGTNDELLFSATVRDDANLTVKKIKLDTETTFKRKVVENTDNRHQDRQELEVIKHIKLIEVDESSSSSLANVKDSLAIDTESAISAANENSESRTDKSNCVDLTFDRSLTVSRVDIKEKSVEIVDLTFPDAHEAARSVDTVTLSDVIVTESKPNDMDIKSSGIIEAKKDREKRNKEKGFLNPVANLTKSERRLRKIKRCSGMSKEFYHKVKSLMKTFPRLRLIEVVRLHKLDKSEIIKFTNVQSNTERNKVPFERSNSVTRVSKPVFTRPKLCQKFLESEWNTSSNREKPRVKDKHRKLKKESPIDEMDKANTVLANRISNLPRIPRKPSVEAIQDKKTPLPRVPSDTKAASEFKIENKKLETKVIKPGQPHRARPLAITPGDEDFDTDSWNRMDFNDFLTLFNANSSNKTERDSGSDVLPVKVGSSVENAENLKRPQSQHRSEFGKEFERSKCSTSDTLKNVVKEENLVTSIQRETESKECSGGRHVGFQSDRLSTCAQWSDDEISIMAPSVCSAFSVEEAETKTSATTVSTRSNRPHNYATETLRTYTHPYGYERVGIWEMSPDTEFDAKQWEEELNVEMTNCELSVEADVSRRFEDDLKNMTHSQLTDLIGHLFFCGNLPKSLLVFERLSENENSELVMKNLSFLLIVARNNKKCLPYIITKFTKTILSHVTKRKEVVEKIDLLYMLFEWLCYVEVESDGQLVIENRRISNGCLSVLLGRDFSSLIEIYNNTMVEALNEDVCEILYLFRYGMQLHLPLDFSVIRALVSSLAECNLWPLCQEVYVIGCGLACYSRIKLRQWPICFTVKSYYTKGEIAILLYDFLFKFHKLLNTSFFRDRQVTISEKTTVYIRFQESQFKDHDSIESLTRVDSTTESVYDRLTTVLQSMLGLSILKDYEVDSARSYVKVKMPLLEMLLKHSQNWFKRYKMSPFYEYRKPGPLDWYSYRMLSTNGFYCQYDRNPFN